MVQLKPVEGLQLYEVLPILEVTDNCVESPIHIDAVGEVVMDNGLVKMVTESEILQPRPSETKAVYVVVVETVASGPSMAGLDKLPPGDQATLPAVGVW